MRTKTAKEHMMEEVPLATISFCTGFRSHAELKLQFIQIPTMENTEIHFKCI